MQNKFYTFQIILDAELGPVYMELRDSRLMRAGVPDFCVNRPLRFCMRDFTFRLLTYPGCPRSSRPPSARHPR